MNTGGVTRILRSRTQLQGQRALSLQDKPMHIYLYLLMGNMHTKFEDCCSKTLDTAGATRASRSWSQLQGQRAQSPKNMPVYTFPSWVMCTLNLVTRSNTLDTAGATLFCGQIDRQTDGYMDSYSAPVLLQDLKNASSDYCRLTDR